MSWVGPRLAAIAERGYDAAWLRSMLVEVNDGIIVTAGVVEGLAGAGATAKTILIAGFSAVVGGGIALGGAKYGEEAAELDARLAILEEEQRQLSLSPEEEMAELVEVYERRGLSSRLAHEVAQALSQRNALAAHLEAEHGLVLGAPLPSPVVSGVAAGLAFGWGSLVPMLSVALAPNAWRVWVIFLAVIVSLTVTSLILAAAGGTNVWRTLIRSVSIGVLAMVLTLASGTLFHS
jgi:VIT1/CCC1 family predicted Fe2+/Mn2+ transporter